MEQYPSIPKNKPDNLIYHIYEKLDGSNLRFEYNRTKGFHKFGSRTQLIDSTSTFGEKSIPLFRAYMEAPFVEYAHSKKLEGLTVFCEFFGPSSCAGFHDFNESFDLRVIDVHVKRKGILPPEEYNELIDSLGVPHACYLGRHLWSDQFVNEVSRGVFPGQTFEGVVGKRYERNKLLTNKAKSQAWIDKVHELHGQNAHKLL